MDKTNGTERLRARSLIVEWLRGQPFTWVAPPRVDEHEEPDAPDVFATVAGQSVGILISRRGPEPEERSRVLAAMSAAGAIAVTVSGVEELRRVYGRIMRDVLHCATCGIPGTLRDGVCRYCLPTERTRAAYGGAEQ